MPTIYRDIEGPRLTMRDAATGWQIKRAAWLGTRITLEQVSEEAPRIFDLILELHRSCDGQ